MKKYSFVKVGFGIVAAAFFAFLPGKTFAADSSIKIGSEEIWVESGTKNNDAETAKYTASSKTLELKGLSTTSEIKVTNVANLTIKLTSNSSASSLTAKGSNITINGTKSLSLSGDLSVTDGNLKFTSGSIAARNIVLKDNDDATQNKITIENQAVLSTSGSIKATYAYTTSTKGIVLANSLCTNPVASIINLSEASGTTTTFSTNGTTAATGLATTTTCTEENPAVPETLDAVYIYAIIFVASSAIFIYRRHLAKR